MPMHPLHKLLVLGLNEALARGLVTLDSAQEGNGHAFATIASQGSVVLWRDIGFGELRLSVWWDYNPAGRLPSEREQFLPSRLVAERSRYRHFVGATASGWLERRSGLHLQGRGCIGLFDTYARRGARAVLAGVSDLVPSGHFASGRLFL